MRQDSAIKKLLKKFYLYFLYIFTIKIFLKNTLLCLDSQKKERRRQISAFLAIFKADFGIFRLFPACSGRIGCRPIRPDMTDMAPILAESAQFGTNQSQFGANRAKSVRIREKKKKNRRRGRTRGQPCRTPRPASDVGAAPLVPRPCFLA